MDKSGKRGAMGNIAAKNRNKVGSKDAASAGDQNAQFCNRIGCHGRIKYSNLKAKIGVSDKAKCSELLSCLSNRNKMIGKSSPRSGSVMIREKGPSLVSKRKLSSPLKSDLVSKRKSSSPLKSDPSGSSDSKSPTKRKLSSPLESDPSRSSDSKSRTGKTPASHQSGSRNKPREVATTKTAGSSGPSTSRPRKLFQHKLGSSKQNTESASSVSKNPGLGMLSSCTKGRCLKNLKCNSVSNVTPPKHSSSGPQSAVKNVTKKRSPEEDSSLSRRGRYTSASGPLISASRHCSSCTPREDSKGDASFRTGRSTYANQSRMRPSYQQNGRNSSCGREPAFRSSELRPIRAGRKSYTKNASSSSGSCSYSHSSCNDDNQPPLMPFNSAEPGFGHLLNHDALQRYSTDRMTDVLLALERIGQDEEMTEEQIAWETNLYLSRLNLDDQHRDMRLDIDNMSYEELLALGERMGTVSTAVSEDTLSKCVRRSVYPSEERFTRSGEDGDDNKCSICQEEYETGDEIGNLVECQHEYHAACINQWLQLKNWCPICKSDASPTESSSSSS